MLSVQDILLLLRLAYLDSTKGIYLDFQQLESRLLLMRIAGSFYRIMICLNSIKSNFAKTYHADPGVFDRVNYFGLDEFHLIICSKRVQENADMRLFRRQRGTNPLSRPAAPHSPFKMATIQFKLPRYRVGFS